MFVCQIGRGGSKENELDEARELLELEDLQQELEWDSPARKRKPGVDCLFCKPDLSEHKVNQLTYTVRLCCFPAHDEGCLMLQNVDLLLRFINERGMIVARKQTGTCAKHQRKLARIIKRVCMCVVSCLCSGPSLTTVSGKKNWFVISCL